MKLNTMQIELPMLQSHYVSGIIFSRYLKLFWKILLRYYPGMISTCKYLFGEFGKNIIIPHNFNWSLYSMKHIWDINQLSTKHLSYSLMTQTYSQNTFTFSKLFDQFNHHTGFFRKSRTW